MTQLGIVAGLLKQRGEQGVGARELTFQHGITRTAAIIHVLRSEGWRIRTEADPGEMARYILEGTGRPMPTVPVVVSELLPGTCVRCDRGHGRHLAAIAAGADVPHEFDAPAVSSSRNG